MIEQVGVRWDIRLRMHPHLTFDPFPRLAPIDVIATG